MHLLSITAFRPIGHHPVVMQRPSRRRRAGLAGPATWACVLLTGGVATTVAVTPAAASTTATTATTATLAADAIAARDTLSARDLDTTIRLRPAARLSPGETTIRLRDVAWLEVAAAERLGGLVVGELRDAATRAEITPATVRAAIAAAGGHPARVLVQGGVIRVTPGTERATAGRPMAMTAVSLGPTGERTSAAASTGTGRRSGADDGGADGDGAWRFVPAAAALPGHDVMAAATHRLLRHLDVPADRLRIGIDEADVPWLGRPMSDMQLRLLDAADAAQVRLEIRARPGADPGRRDEGGRIAVLRPQVRVERVRAAEDVQRGTRLEPAMLATITEWASPRTAGMAMAADEIIGLEADRRLAEGRVIGPGDIQRPLVIRRGDSMIVRAGDAGIPLEITVVAREDGRIGDRITVRRPGDEMEFRVIVVAPGLGRPDAPPALGTPRPALSRVARR